MHYFRFLCLIGLYCSAPFFTVQAQPELQYQDQLIIGQRLFFHSEVLNEDRILNIYLPPNYGVDSIVGFPVIYLLDGSWEEDFMHIAGLTQFTSMSWINLTPRCIVVGIENVDRRRDFTPPTSIPEDQKEFPTAGGSAKFMQCLKNEIIPLVEDQFQCIGPRSIIGQSLGGLLVSEVLFTEPELFDNYLIVSPSFWWDNASMLKREMPKNLEFQRIYLCVGNEGAEMVEPLKIFLKKLRASGAMHLEYVESPEFSHGDILHIAAYNGLEFLFAR